MDYYSAIKQNEILPFTTTWVDPKGIMLTETSQRKTNIILHLYRESKKQNRLTKKLKRNRLIKRENKLVVVAGRGE